MTRARLAWLIGPWVLLWGCTFSDGDFLTTLVPGTLSARLVASADRFTADGWLITDAGWELRLMSLTVSAVDLTLSGAGAGDGDGGDGAGAPVVVLPVMADVPVATRVPGTPVPGVPLAACRPLCGLGPVVLTGAQLSLRRLHLQGQVRREVLPPQPPGPEQDLSLDLDLSPFSDTVLQVAGPLAMVIDRTVPDHLQVSALFLVSAALGDGIDWSSANGAAPRQQLVANLAQSSLTLDLMAPQQ